MLAKCHRLDVDSCRDLHALRMVVCEHLKSSSCCKHDHGSSEVVDGAEFSTKAQDLVQGDPGHVEDVQRDVILNGMKAAVKSLSLKSCRRIMKLHGFTLPDNVPHTAVKSPGVKQHRKCIERNLESIRKAKNCMTIFV